MISGTQYMIFGTQHVISGTQHVISGTQYIISDTQHTISGRQHVISGTHNVICGTSARAWTVCTVLSIHSYLPKDDGVGYRPRSRNSGLHSFGSGAIQGRFLLLKPETRLLPENSPTQPVQFSRPAPAGLLTFSRFFPHVSK